VDGVVLTFTVPCFSFVCAKAMSGSLTSAGAPPPLAHVYGWLLPYLSSKDSRSFSLALGPIARSRAHAILPLAARGIPLSSTQYHTAIEGLVGHDELALLAAACKGGPEPFAVVHEAPETVEAAIAAALAK
jgi:hypothetical protein